MHVYLQTTVQHVRHCSVQTGGTSQLERRGQTTEKSPSPRHVEGDRIQSGGALHLDDVSLILCLV